MCFNLRFDRIEPRLNLSRFERWAQHPGAEQAFAHGRDGRVEGAEERDSGVVPANSGSISSRLRTVVASSTRQFCRS